MKNMLKKTLLASLLTTAACLGTAGTNQAKADGFVCVGTTLYASHGWWIFQFPYGQPLGESTSCEGY